MPCHNNAGCNPLEKTEGQSRGNYFSATHCETVQFLQNRNSLCITKMPVLLLPAVQVSCEQGRYFWLSL